MESNVGIVYHVNELKHKEYRILSHEGGTRSGKTFNTVEWLIDYAEDNKEKEITIASRDMPHLKKGAMKDFLDILQKKRRVFNSKNWNATDKKYKFNNGSYIEFLNADDIGKVSGPGRDVLYCNEVNFFKKPVFDQLLMRTRGFCIVDYNPIHPKHWVYTSICDRPDCFTWTSTYLDNIQFLPAEQIKEIEMMRETDPLRWHVYGLGKRGFYQKGQIYGQKPNKPWESITLTEYNKIDAVEYFPLDWGFYPDPNAMLGVKAVGNKRYIRKILYQQKLSNKQTTTLMKEEGLTKDSIVIAGVDDEKSINEFRTLGFPLTYKAVGGPGSVLQGIKKLQSLEIYYVTDPDIEFEYYNYVYLLGPDEQPTGIPQDKHNHLMDCLRMFELYKKYL